VILLVIPKNERVLALLPKRCGQFLDAIIVKVEIQRSHVMARAIRKDP
jgi:hypothetical protein